MRVILTIDYSPWSSYSGGAQLSTHNLATALAQRGHEVHVVFTKPPWENIEPPDQLGYKLHWAVLPAFRSVRNTILRPFSAYFVARTVNNILNENHGRWIVHCNGEEGGLLSRMSNRNKCLVVSTPRHSLYPSEFRSGQKESFWALVMLALTDGKYLMQRRAALHADVVAPTSKHAALLIAGALGVDKNKMVIISNGVSGDFLDQPPTRSLNGFLCYFGRLDDTKGVDLIIDAIASIQEDIPKTILIGHGPRENYYRKRILSLGLSDRIEIKGWMSSRDLAQYIRQAQLAIFPSKIESFGVSIANAMAVGLPVIATDAGAIPELVSHDDTGFLIPNGDSVALKDAILELTSNKERASRLAESGSAYVRSNYTWKSAAKKFEDTYKRILESQP